MTRIYTAAQPLSCDIVDAFCTLQKGFTDQFVYYDKERAARYLGLGRCIAVPSLDGVEYQAADADSLAPVFFSFSRFDAPNPSPADELFSVFPNLRLMLPEVVLVHNEQGSFLQVNSLGPVYAGRVERFVRQANQAAARKREPIPYTLERDARPAWEQAVGQALSAIREQRVNKVVLARRVRLQAQRVFSSKDLLVNLIDGPAKGTVYMYRYGDVFFCGCTPELLVRKRGSQVESACVAGTIGVGASEEEANALAAELLADEKNRTEHEFVVDFMRAVVGRTCFDAHISASPQIKRLTHLQHLYTPVNAQIMDGRSLLGLLDQLHPTPALAGAPVGEAMMLIRSIEGFNRGFFGGPVGVVDANGDGEFSVGIRSGVFDGEVGWLYAGCGIVEGSQAASEYDEIDLKLKTILTAFE